MQNKKLLITECPRDAMQGIHNFIDTEKKTQYLKTLLSAGFDYIDAGSFVSPKAIPQLADTKTVFDNLLPYKKNNKIIAIVANKRGAEEALNHPFTDVIGFPLSASETFQNRNTNSSIAQAMDLVKEIVEMAETTSKKAVIYLSMAFGNPYGDEYSGKVVKNFITKLNEVGVKWVALSDTIGSATPDLVKEISEISLKQTEGHLSLHLHCRPENANNLIVAGVSAGINHFDSALGGFGGCPMAADSLTGNLPTEELVKFAGNNDFTIGLAMDEVNSAQRLLPGIFA